MYLIIGGWISYTPSVECIVGWTTRKTSPILITSCLHRKDTTCVHFAFQRAWEQGNEKLTCTGVCRTKLYPIPRWLWIETLVTHNVHIIATQFHNQTWTQKNCNVTTHKFAVENIFKLGRKVHAVTLQACVFPSVSVKQLLRLLASWESWP